MKLGRSQAAGEHRIVAPNGYVGTKAVTDAPEMRNVAAGVGDSALNWRNVAPCGN